MTKFAYKRRDIKIIVSGDIVELIQYRVPVNCEKRDYEIVKDSRDDLHKKEEKLTKSALKYSPLYLAECYTVFKIYYSYIQRYRA